MIYTPSLHRGFFSSCPIHVISLYEQGHFLNIAQSRIIKSDLTYIIYIYIYLSHIQIPIFNKMSCSWVPETGKQIFLRDIIFPQELNTTLGLFHVPAASKNLHLL